MFRTIIFFCVVLSSCTNQKTSDDGTLGRNGNSQNIRDLDEEVQIQPPGTAESQAPPEYSLEKRSKIIRNGNMSFEVDILDEAKTKVDAILKSAKGYYEKELYNAYGNRTTYSLILRIPNSKFDSIVSILENGIGKLAAKNLNAQDVTEEYVDLNIRLESNLAYLDQYRAILARAISIKEVLEVQEKIRQIEEEIDSKKGRIKYLDDKVKYSTLNVEITSLLPNDLLNKPSFGRRVSIAFNNGGQIFLSFLIGLVNLWPFLIVFLLIVFGRKRILGIINRLVSPPKE